MTRPLNFFSGFVIYNCKKKVKLKHTKYEGIVKILQGRLLQ